MKYLMPFIISKDSINCKKLNIILILTSMHIFKRIDLLYLSHQTLIHERITYFVVDRISEVFFKTTPYITY